MTRTGLINREPASLFSVGRKVAEKELARAMGTERCSLGAESNWSCGRNGGSIVAVVRGGMRAVLCQAACCASWVPVRTVFNNGYAAVVSSLREATVWPTLRTACLPRVDTLCRIASISKPITATAALKLVEAGKLTFLGKFG